MIQLSQRPLSRRAFTLIELLVVIVIILVLAGILIPTVSSVLNSAREAKSKAFISQLEGAIEQYHSDFKAYPGVFPDAAIYNSLATSANMAPGFAQGLNVITGPVAGYDLTKSATWYTKISEAESMFLSLMGGLKVDAVNNALLYDPSQVGQGPLSLGAGPTKRTQAYLTVDLNTYTSMKSSNNGLGLTGKYKDDAASADDTLIPEFVDQFSSPMPILYLRYRASAKDVTMPISQKNNGICTYDAADPNDRLGSYDLHQILSYTGVFTSAGVLDTTYPPASTSSCIGVGKSLPQACTDGTGTLTSWKGKTPFHGLNRTFNNGTDPTVASPNQISQSSYSTAKYYYPYDAYAYFRNPTLSNNNTGTATQKYGDIANTEIPRQKEGFILISAGKDRIYGTDDDITNFGSITP